MPELSLGIFTTDTDLVIRTWDPWLAQVTGIPAEQARGRPLTELVPDLAGRGLLARFQNVLQNGLVEILAPTFHHYLIPCPPSTPSPRFSQMQQRVVIAPLRQGDLIMGTIVTVEDVTARLDREHDLAEQLASPDESVRLRAAEALAAEEGEAATLLTNVLGDQSWRVRRAAVEGLAQRRAPEKITDVLRTLRAEHRDLNVLNSALQVLALSEVETVTSLIMLLADPDAELRTYAALVLGERRNPRAIPALLDALADPDPNVCYHAIEALGKLRAAEAVDHLLKLASGGDFFLAFPALDALTRIGDPSVAPRIVPLLEDEMLQVPAAEALGQLGDEHVVEPLAKLLNRPAAPVSAVAGALATLYDRYETRYGEGAHIADLARGAITPAGAQNLLDALGQASGPELRNLALVLGWLEGPAVERALTRLLAEPSVRKEVVEALARHGPRVTELLIEQLQAEERDTRQAAVIAMGRIGDSRVVPALLEALARDEELAVVIAGALAKIGDRQAYEGLLELIGHPNPMVRQAVISALNSLGHPDMPARMAVLLGDPNPLVRESAARIAGYFGYQVCNEPLLACCHDPDENVRRAAVEQLPYLEDERALPTLVAALQKETPKVRASAARAMAYVEGSHVLNHLLAALEDPDPWVRYYAAAAIGRHGFAEAVDALGKLVQADPAPFVRASAMEALGHIGGARSAALIAPYAEAEDYDMARAALDALGLIRHPDSLPPLLATLRHRDPQRRIDAARALGTRGGAGVAGALQWAAAADSDPRVVQAAIHALARLGSQEAVAALISLAANQERREACIAALAGLGLEQLPWLTRGLTHPNPGCRQATVEALARMKRPEATEQLIAGLRDKDPAVRLAAVTALSHLSSHRAERTLLALAHNDPDPAVRRAAQAALQK